jgi:hypothetical protein
MMTQPLLDQLQRKLDTLPDGPGVYLWKDAAGDVLYVGKAKRLRSRVRSYFATDFAESPKNRLLQRLNDNPDRCVLVGAYALGKAQRVIDEMRCRGHHDPMYIHGALERLCELYAQFGVPLG